MAWARVAAPARQPARTSRRALARLCAPCASRRSAVPPSLQVASRGPGDSFGELALLYNCPRAATIQADTPGLLWALDRVTFRFMVASTREGQLGEIVAGLRGVEMLKTLTEDQLNRVAEAVKVVTYRKGERIITKGELGNEWYFVKS